MAQLSNLSEMSRLYTCQRGFSRVPSRILRWRHSLEMHMACLTHWGFLQDRAPKAPVSCCFWELVTKAINTIEAGVIAVLCVFHEKLASCTMTTEPKGGSRNEFECPCNSGAHRNGGHERVPRNSLLYGPRTTFRLVGPTGG